MKFKKIINQYIKEYIYTFFFYFLNLLRNSLSKLSNNPFSSDPCPLNIKIDKMITYYNYGINNVIISYVYGFKYEHLEEKNICISVKIGRHTSLYLNQ
jgi:hypothetical protein